MEGISGAAGGTPGVPGAEGGVGGVVGAPWVASRGGAASGPPPSPPNESPCAIQAASGALGASSKRWKARLRWHRL
eukprot:15434567-Alexandrium_andersonii.AAC.1